MVHASDRAAITPRVGISQQEGSLKGTVSDSFGPVAGASIVVKGTTNGTVTDMNGNFVLDAKKGDVILVAGKGHEDYQEIKGVKHHFDDREKLREIFSTQQS